MKTDSLLKVQTIAFTPKPEFTVYMAAKQDYSSEPVYNLQINKPDSSYGEECIAMLLAGGKGHFGCLEHPQITFNVCNFPHSAVMQARTHRIGVSFDVQSFRYTSKAILSIVSREDALKRFYFRPIGFYRDRFGSSFNYTQDDLDSDLDLTMSSVQKYKHNIQVKGQSEEHARECLTTNYRQHFVVSFNLRSLMHFLDLRAKKDAQLEIQQMSDLILEQALLWSPTLVQWYVDNRLGKARLSP